MVLAALRASHPYEEIAYYLQPLQNLSQDIGSGMIGELAEPTDFFQFLDYIKGALDVPYLKHSKVIKEKVHRVAICGGSGAFLIKDAIAAGADVFLTSDLKYHDYFEAERKITFVDAGHYETEQYTSELIAEFLSQKMSNIASVLTTVLTNPVRYY
jgi:putative NIF3 family GTP cyclohydrolase 1 type 2